MPLTPTDVANKQFRIAFRGYSLDEVDAFLDEVENELSRLLRDNNALQQRGGAPAPVPLTKTPDAPAPAPASAAAAPLASMEGQEAALRTLLLAQRTADEAIAEARAEAEEIVSSARAEADSTLGAARSEAESTLTSARSEAESTLTSARAEAERTLTEAQGKAGRVDQEVASRIQAATGDLDARRRALEGRIEELRAFEREYRTRLKAYLENQLRELGSGAGPDDSGAGVPAAARTAAVGLSKAPDGPVPVAGPGGPGPVSPAQEGSSQDAPDGPPREAGSSSALRAVPPLASGAAPVGPFTVVQPGDGNDADR